MVEVMKIMVTSFKRSHACTATLNAPKCSSPPPTHASVQDGWTLMGKSESVSCGVTVPFSWCTQGFVCALQESVSPVLCKFWLLHGGVNGDLLQEGLCRPRSAGPRNGMGITEGKDNKKR